MPLRQCGVRVDQQDLEGEVRLPGKVFDALWVAGEAKRLRALVQQLQASFDVGLPKSFRVQGSRPDSLKNLSRLGLPIQPTRAEKEMHSRGVQPDKAYIRQHVAEIGREAPVEQGSVPRSSFGSGTYVGTGVDSNRFRILFLQRVRNRPRNAAI